ncbi:hypothetical protein [Enterobacter hormaechei]|uniref:hypothetical protein n=1 Tax=Enterobacter hormaechei TaxID=158836 RepID=UPI0009413BB0|nr:hypothetical protein [Enterobacter hormaechei]
MDDFVRCRYAWEKFHGAVSTLAMDETYDKRLVDAYVFNIVPLDKKRDIPHEVAERFEELERMMTSFEANPKEGRVAASVRTMDELEKSRAAELIISIYDSLCRLMPVR